MRITAALVAVALFGCSAAPTVEEHGDIDTADEYIAAILDKIKANWRRPASVTPGFRCHAKLKQSIEGAIESIEVQNCIGTEGEVLAIYEAIKAASPLPVPNDPVVFEPNVTLVLGSNELFE